MLWLFEQFSSYIQLNDIVKNTFIIQWNCAYALHTYIFAPSMPGASKCICSMENTSKTLINIRFNFKMY